MPVKHVLEVGLDGKTFSTGVDRADFWQFFRPVRDQSPVSQAQGSGTVVAQQGHNIGFRRNIVAGVELEIQGLLEWYFKLPELVEEVFEFKEPEPTAHDQNGLPLNGKMPFQQFVNKSTSYLTSLFECSFAMKELTVGCFLVIKAVNMLT